MRIAIVFSESHPLSVEQFRQELPGYEIVPIELPAGGQHVEATEQLTTALSDCHGVMIRAGLVTDDVLSAAPNLRVIAVPGSGCDHIDLDAATAHNVVVVHNPDVHALGVVEHTFMLTFMLLRELPNKAEMTKAGNWLDARQPVKQLGHQTLGVVGLGTIGFRVAETAVDRFDTHVVGADPYVTGERNSDLYPRHERSDVEAAGVELVTRQEVFERADVVTVHVPLSDETHHLVGENELQRLSGGYLVNTSRGPVVDEEALLEAIQDDILAGAALDVMTQEPPDPDNPLLAADNVIVTPHIAGVTEGYLDRAAVASAKKIHNVLSGERPEWAVNPSVFEDN
jgi:D-3-phosphoglycerate dehydrogenase